ncbi:MAG: thioredoxin family protein [Sedimentisphaerales bacterium]|nr:thioredoxin family protein [Sedimentisphaerales bacterium]
MTDKNNNVTQISESQNPAQNRKDSKKPLLFIALVFISLVVIVFTTQKKDPIGWVRNYQDAVDLARKTNKPLLLVFYKPNAPMFTAASDDTYINPKVKKFVEANFVPVLINVLDRPDLVEQFGINYYPTHYVKQPDNDELFGPRLGYDPPELFIEKMQNLLDEMNKKS